MRVCLKILLLTLLNGLGVGNAAWAAKEPLVLKSSGKWVVNYGDDSCRLSRQFGTEKDTVFLVFDRFGPGDEFTLTLGGSPFKYDGLSREINIQFGPKEQPQNISFFPGDFGKGVPAIIGRGATNIGILTDADIRKLRENFASGKPDPKLFDPEREAAVTYILVGKPLRQPVRLETGAMQKPFAALDTCIDNLVASWGVDVEKHKTLTKYAAPIGSPANWITSNDYPKEPLSTGGQAIVHVRLSIDEAGKVTACHIQQSTRGKGFDEAVCKALTKRAKFTPALDAGGIPIASFWRQAVAFQIPN